jgi:hypothetical protein
VARPRLSEGRCRLRPAEAVRPGADAVIRGQQPGESGEERRPGVCGTGGSVEGSERVVLALLPGTTPEPSLTDLL